MPKESDVGGPEPEREKTKADPAIIAKARELRDKWIEQVNAQPSAPTLGKYDVARLAA